MSIQHINIEELATKHDNLPWLYQGIILCVIHGSHAYGMNTPESDLDLKGIAIPPAAYFHGFLQTFDQAESKDPDMVIYGIRKFFKLASDANPNVLELLFVDESSHLLVTDAGRKLIAHRDLFLSTKVRHTYAGYAFAQLKRIKTHRAWLLNPREHKPIRGQFNLPETSLLSADILGAMEAVVKDNAEGATEFPAHMMDLYQKERSYQNALREYQQYQNWKLTRNPKRAAIEAEFGVDLKHAAHLVRLARSGKELLSTGKLQVKRPDAEELLAIRNGAWSYEQIVEYAEGIEKEMEALEKTSPLPHSPDRVALDRLCQKIVEDSLQT